MRFYKVSKALHVIKMFTLSRSLSLNSRSARFSSMMEFHFPRSLQFNLLINKYLIIFPVTVPVCIYAWNSLNDTLYFVYSFWQWNTILAIGWFSDFLYTIPLQFSLIFNYFTNNRKSADILSSHAMYIWYVFATAVVCSFYLLYDCISFDSSPCHDSNINISTFVTVLLNWWAVI